MIGAQVRQQQVGPTFGPMAHAIHGHRRLGGHPLAGDQQRQRPLSRFQVPQQHAAGDRFGVVAAVRAIVTGEDGAPHAGEDFAGKDFLDHAAQRIPGSVGRFGRALHDGAGRTFAGPAQSAAARGVGKLSQGPRPAIEPAFTAGPILFQARRRELSVTGQQHRRMRRGQAGQFHEFAALHGRNNPKRIEKAKQKSSGRRKPADQPARLKSKSPPRGPAEMQRQSPRGLGPCRRHQRFEIRTKRNPDAMRGAGRHQARGKSPNHAWQQALNKTLCTAVAAIRTGRRVAPGQHCGESSTSFGRAILPVPAATIANTAL